MTASLKRKAIATVVIVIAAAVLVWLAAPIRNRAGGPQKDAQTIKPGAAAPGAVSISESSQKKAGIVTMPLELVSHREELRAYGTVLQANDLIGMRKDFAAVKASMDRSSALLDASAKEYERLKALYEDNRNVSEKALQAAEAKWRSDEATAYEAKISLQTVESAVRLYWGDKIGAWIFDSSPQFRRLITVEDVLIRVTLPPDLQIAAEPQRIRVQLMGRSSFPAKFVSRAPATDPRIQGMSFFYLSPSYKARLIPGMNVEAYMPAGPGMRGVFIPAEAIVWQNGRAWGYVLEDTVRFVRRPVPTEYPVKGGYLAVKGFSAGERIAVKGAQMLLSAEFQPARHEEED